MTTATATRANGTKPVGRVPPHDLQAEESLLGAMLLSRDARDVAVGLIDHADYYKPAHATIHQAIAELHEHGEPVDATTVADVLSRHGQLDDIGGTASLVALASGTPATTSAARYAAIVRDHALLRQAIYAAAALIEDAYKIPDDLASLAPHLRSLDELLDRATTRTGPRPVGDVLDDWMAAVDERAEGTSGATPTGFHDLDELLGGGLHPGQLITVAGRTSLGKTQLGVAVALNIAAAGQPVLFCSVEMDELEVAERWIASHSRVSASSLRRGAIAPKDWPRVEQSVGALGCFPLYIDDRAEQTVNGIRAAARAMPRMPVVIVVDYIQILKAAARNDSNRQAEVAEISGGLKRLARRLEVAIVALAQLNRGPEGRNDKRPQLADLRESGSIENDSDVVIGLYRDEYYNPDSPDRGVLEAIVMKQRSGPKATVRLAWLAEWNAIKNMRESGAPPQQEELM